MARAGVGLPGAGPKPCIMLPPLGLAGGPPMSKAAKLLLLGGAGLLAEGGGAELLLGPKGSKEEGALGCMKSKPLLPLAVGPRLGWRGGAALKGSKGAGAGAGGGGGGGACMKSKPLVPKPSSWEAGGAAVKAPKS